MSAVLNEGWCFRAVEHQDLDAIMKIETAVYEYPWSQGIFRDCLRVGYDCVLLETENHISAYAVMTVGAKEAHLLNLCVHPEQQRQGIGRTLLQHMLERARRLNADTVFLEVRCSNNGAIALYHACGFNEIGIRKNYYPAANGRENAVILALSFQ